jgi:DNA invertase Pin-like site-specific DNA recombinase
MDAVVYARYSPRPDDSNSIAYQILACREYCVRQQWRVVAEYSDEHASGGDRNREGLIKALDHVKSIKGSLVVYQLWRLCRSTKDAIEIADELDAANCNLGSVSENVDTTSAVGRAFFQMMAVIGELERNMIRERTSIAMLNHMKDGRSMSSKPPYGFGVKDGRLYRDEHEQQVIARTKEIRNLPRGAIWEILHQEGLLNTGTDGKRKKWDGNGWRKLKAAIERDL